MTTLSVDGLTKRFGNFTAVNELSFEAQAGEIISLLGPNGAGKSTTFLTLAGLMRPDAGTITWEQRILGADRGRSIALIPETPEVYSLLTVWEHLVFVAQSCKLSDGWERRANDLIERFNLGEKRDTLGAALSKGLRQKTLIVATLLADAPIFLFDEPMIGLDPAGQRELRDALVELRDAGKAIIVSTHMLDAAQATSSRAVILKNGRCVFSGSFDEFHALDPQSDIESLFLRLTS